ncbi:hypothetical protein GCM10007425_04800 [Lysinibacillus alkalisoli]|uniref:DUF418 domain-containing protein n=1 Tax=Lysinibacillus alkalisoli TaxID=1911548 RepID=A0A917FW34_9BACI|nr:DUF418 domain-containing protein [Lysinibacillus alkalisoli]GGG13519.1 hypothetical protein GCM10007425_04800 [Lysinibacillus alkalisoli]
MNNQPTLMNERNITLDVLRGFSLLGIILVNLLAFNTPLPNVDLASFYTLPSDIKWQQLLDIYVQGSFYPLFAMLFGYGLAMQWQKSVARDQPFFSTGIRRMVGLLIIGLLHAFLIWWGDILMMYAVFGTILLLFLRLQPVLLVVMALFLNGLLQIGFFILMPRTSFEEGYYLDVVSTQQALGTYATGTWKEIFDQRLLDLAVQNDITMWFVGFFTILPYMLIGAAASKWQLIQRAKQVKGLWMALAVICIPLGIFLKNLPILQERTFFLDYIKTYVGGPITALGYAAIIVLLCMSPLIAKVMNPFAKVGRMSLTTYIGQSIILSVLFYGYGFGWYGKIGVQAGIVIALAIFVVQVIIAELWLARFKQGPIEWLWRKFTYGKLRTKE